MLGSCQSWTFISFTGAQRANEHPPPGGGGALGWTGGLCRGRGTCNNAGRVLHIRACGKIEGGGWSACGPQYSPHQSSCSGQALKDKPWDVLSTTPQHLECELQPNLNSTIADSPLPPPPLPGRTQPTLTVVRFLPPRLPDWLPPNSLLWSTKQCMCVCTMVLLTELHKWYSQAYSGVTSTAPVTYRLVGWAGGTRGQSWTLLYARAYE
jgi:hypothetical protein